jgi:hypothetical protein
MISGRPGFRIGPSQSREGDLAKAYTTGSRVSKGSQAARPATASIRAAVVTKPTMRGGNTTNWKHCAKRPRAAGPGRFLRRLMQRIPQSVMSQDYSNASCPTLATVRHIWPESTRLGV